MKDSLRMFGKMSLRVAAFLVLIFPVYFITLPAETEVYRQNHKPVSITQTKEEIGPDFVVRVNASSDEFVCDKAIDDTGNWTQDPDLALFKTEANKRGLSCAGWIPKHLRAKWGIERVDEEEVVVSVVPKPNEKNSFKKVINLNGSRPSPAKLTGVMSLKGNCTVSRISQTQTSCRDRIIHTSYDTSRIGFYFLSDRDQQDLLIVAYSGLAIALQKPSSDARIQPIDMLIVSGEIIKGSGECYFENPYGGNKARIECDFQPDKGIRYSNYFMTDGQKPDIVEIPTG